MSGRVVALRFGQNLARERRLADVTQEQLSRLCSLHRTEISQLERGLRVPRIDTVAKLAGSLEAPVEDFFNGIVWRPGQVSLGSFRTEEQR